MAVPVAGRRVALPNTAGLREEPVDDAADLGSHRLETDLPGLGGVERAGDPPNVDPPAVRAGARRLLEGAPQLVR